MSPGAATHRGAKDLRDVVARFCSTATIASFCHGRPRDLGCSTGTWSQACRGTRRQCAHHPVSGVAVDTGWSLESHRWRVSRETVLKRDRSVVLGGLIGISLVAWAYTGYLAWDMHHMAMTMPQMQGWGVVDLLLLYLMGRHDGGHDGAFGSADDTDVCHY